MTASDADRDPSRRPLRPEELEDRLASLAHELNTPLTVIGSAVDLLRRGPEDLDRWDEIVDALARNVRLMTMIVSRLRTLRASRESLATTRRPTDLVRVVRETVDDLRHSVLSQHDAQVEAPPLLVAEVDALLVREMLYNLLSNAAKFSPDDREIRVVVRSVGDRVELAVQDRGKGVAPEDAELIFERFGRADDSVPGLGVGLHLSREIARAHGGDLVLDPSPEEGARFVATIPVDAT